MDLLSFGFLVLIVLTSGFVAWLGDKVGKKLGKKRLSFMGLRPRHTAEGGTFLLGLLISIITISLVSAFSSDVRVWITEGRRAIRDLEKTKTELAFAQNDLKDVQSKFELDQQQIRVLEAQIRRGSLKLADQDKTNQQLTDRQKALQWKLARITDEVKKRDAQIVLTERQIKTITTTLADNKRRLTKASGDLAFAVKERNRSLLQNKGLDDTNVKLAAQIEGQKTEVQDLETQRTQLETQKGDLEKDLGQARLNLGDLRKILSDETEKLSEAKQELAKATDELDKVNELTASLSNSVIFPSRRRPLIYRFDEEIARLAVPANLNEKEARKALDELLAGARTEGARRGARSHRTKDRNYAVADFYDRPDGTTSDQIKNAIVKRLIGVPQEEVLIAYADMNVFEDEPIPLDAAILPNPVIYLKDQVVAESEINGQSTLGDIFQQLRAFVGVRLKNKIKQDQMIPQDVEAQSFGSLSTDRVLELVSKVKSAGRTVHLQAMAQMETRAADPLNLEFRIQ